MRRSCRQVMEGGGAPGGGQLAVQVKARRQFEFSEGGQSAWKDEEGGYTVARVVWSADDDEAAVLLLDDDGDDEPSVTAEPLQLALPLEGCHSCVLNFAPPTSKPGLLKPDTVLWSGRGRRVGAAEPRVGVGTAGPSGGSRALQGPP